MDEQANAADFFDQLLDDFRRQYLNYFVGGMKSEPGIKLVEMNRPAYQLLATHCVWVQLLSYKKVPTPSNPFAELQAEFRGADFHRVDEWPNDQAPRYRITIR